jgi:hypothetical protein
MYKSYKKLLGVLEQLVIDNKKLIQKETTKFQDTSSHYRNISVTPELQVVMLKSNRTSTTLNIGFPFPLYTKETKALGMATKEKIEIKYFLRGKPIRNFQRNDLLRRLCKIGPTEAIEISNLQQFQNICKKLSERYHSFTYVDPYVFIGDSFIGLHFSDNIKKNFDLSLDRIYSNASKHLEFAFQTEMYGDPSFSNKLVVIPDLIDNHWPKTVGTLIRSLNRDGTFFVIGRNLVVDREKGVIRLYHFDKDEPLLRNKNIEDYMNDCLSPYVQSLCPSRFNKPIEGKFNLIINPFGLEDEKLLPIKLVLDIIRYVKTKYPECAVIVVEGLERHSFWIKEFRSHLMRIKLEQGVSIRSYNSLSEIAIDIKRNNVTLGITADTSLAHMFNLIGLRNLTFYNAQRWDENSMQSLASDSPLGFCRYTSLQFPIIFDGENRISSISVLRGLNYVHDKIASEGRILLKHRKTDEKWMRKLFDQDRIVSSVKGKSGSEYLVETAKKISPLYKYAD